MKKIIVALAAASLLFASCSDDDSSYCRCTTKTFDGSGEMVTEVTTETPYLEDNGCTDVEKAGSKDFGDLGKTVVDCWIVP